MQTLNSSTLRMLVLVLFVLTFVLSTYTFLHESGHALAGFLFGQTLTEFHINLFKWEAHVGMAGTLTSSQRAIQSAAGTVLPLLVWFVGIRLAPRKASYSLEILKLIGSMVVLNTLLAWIVLPLLYMLGKAPSDDVTNFLQYSQIAPLLLTLIAAVLYARGWSFFLSKIDGLRNEFLLFSTTDRVKPMAEARTASPWMAGILTFCVLLTFLLNTFVADGSAKTFSVPPDFELVAEIDLAAQTYSNRTLAQFTLDKSTAVGIFIIVREINTTYFDLRVTGPDGYSSAVLHGEGL